MGHLIWDFIQVDLENCPMETELRKAGCFIFDRVIRRIDDEQPIIQVCLYLDN